MPGLAATYKNPQITSEINWSAHFKIITVQNLRCLKKIQTPLLCSLYLLHDTTYKDCWTNTQFVFILDSGTVYNIDAKIKHI